MYNNSTFFIGVDLGDKQSYIAMLNQDGVLIEETRLPTSLTSFHQRFFALPPSRVAGFTFPLGKSFANGTGT